MGRFTFSGLDQKNLFWFGGTFGPKNQNYRLKLKFGTLPNWNMLNSMVIIIFLFGTDRKYLLRKIWFKNSKLSV